MLRGLRGRPLLRAERSQRQKQGQGQRQGPSGPCLAQGPARAVVPVSGRVSGWEFERGPVPHREGQRSLGSARQSLGQAPQRHGRGPWQRGWEGWSIPGRSCRAPSGGQSRGCNPRAKRAEHGAAPHPPGAKQKAPRIGVPLPPAVRGFTCRLRARAPRNADRRRCAPASAGICAPPPWPRRCGRQDLQSWPPFAVRPR